MNKKLTIFAVIVLGVAFILNALHNLSRDVSLSDWASQASGYSDAFEQQKQSGKPIAVLFYTDWCAACKTLKAEVLSSPKVQDYMKTLHAVKINPEMGQDAANLAKQFGVKGYPMFFMVLKNGQEVKYIRRTNNITPEQFIAQLEKATRP